jgi:hypothetical protein
VVVERGCGQAVVDMPTLQAASMSVTKLPAVKFRNCCSGHN